jgi:C-terminal domain 7 of the ABC-three component (ABC-3C) systems
VHFTSADKGDRIVAAEMEAQVADLRQQFKQDALPIADDLLNLPSNESLFTEKGQALFVRQIELAKAGEKRMLAAIPDYYRTFEQRSRWLRDDLLVVGDLTNYERRLVEEWELAFAAVKDEIGVEAAETAKEEAARKVLRWAETTLIPIRPRVTEPFVTRGSLHMLADQLRVGWHSEFRERLGQLLSPAQTAA